MSPLPAHPLLAGGGRGAGRKPFPGRLLSGSERLPLDRAAVFEALAQGLEISQVLDKFRLTRQELQGLFQKVADACRRRESGFWRLFCDGASRGNPGQAGAGALLYDPQGAIKAEISHYLGETTNNVAEYQALILGLQEAARLGVRKLQVFADSELLVRQLNGQYRVKAPHLLPLYRSAKVELQKFESHAISHVPRDENRLADDLANQAIDQKPTAR